MLRPNGGGSSGKKNDPVSGCRNFWIVRTPKMSKLKHSLGILVSNLTLRTDILLVLLLFHLLSCLHFLIATTVSSVRSPVRNLRFWVLQLGISVPYLSAKRNAQLPGASPDLLRPQWNLREAIGLTLKSWETFGRRWLYRIFHQEWSWEAVSQIYFPSQSWLKLCTKAPPILKLRSHVVFSAAC